MFVDIKWYEWFYKINENWDILNNKRNTLLKPQLDTKWYLAIFLSMKWMKRFHRIHRLVWLNFIPIIEWKNFINHKDWNKLNNNVNNLEWCTQKENSNHAIYCLHKANYNRMRSIIKLDFNWNIIKQYNSIEEWFKDSWLKSRNNIYLCLKWIRKSAWWFVYKYL